MSWKSLGDSLARRGLTAPILEDGDIQHAVERLLTRRLPQEAFAVRVTPRRIRISAVSPAVRQTALLLAADIEHLLAEELHVAARDVQVTRW